MPGLGIGGPGPTIGLYASLGVLEGTLEPDIDLTVGFVVVIDEVWREVERKVERTLSFGPGAVADPEVENSRVDCVGKIEALACGLAPAFGTGFERLVKAHALEPGGPVLRQVTDDVEDE